MEINNDKGSLTVDPKLIGQMAQSVCKGIEGVKLPRDRAVFPRGYDPVNVDESEDGYTVDIDVIVDGVRPVVEVVAEVQERVAAELERHLQKPPTKVNVITKSLG